MARPQISTEFLALRKQHNACARLIAGDFALADDEVSGWNVGRHLFHVLKANYYAYRNVDRILEGYHPLVEMDGDLNPNSARLLRLGRLPRGAPAPEVVQPPESVTRELLNERLSMAAGALSVIISRENELPTAKGFVRHPLLGALDAASWIRFARIHTDHHLRIIDRIQAAGNVAG